MSDRGLKRPALFPVIESLIFEMAGRRCAAIVHGSCAPYRRA